MPYRRLFIFVEGPDDLRFFERIIKPRLEATAYEWVEVRPYAGMKPDKVNAFLRSIDAMGANYILAADLDECHCPSEKKATLHHRYPASNSNKIIIVVREIECWYLSGLADNSCKRLGMKQIGSTNQLTKEDFIKLKPKKYDSRIDWMTEILRLFSIELAVEKNQSIAYFLRKWKC